MQARPHSTRGPLSPHRHWAHPEASVSQGKAFWAGTLPARLAAGELLRPGVLSPLLWQTVFAQFLRTAQFDFLSSLHLPTSSLTLPEPRQGSAPSAHCTEEEARHREVSRPCGRLSKLPREAGRTGLSSDSLSLRPHATSLRGPGAAGQEGGVPSSLGRPSQCRRAGPLLRRLRRTCLFLRVGLPAPSTCGPF